MHTATQLHSSASWSQLQVNLLCVTPDQSSTFNQCIHTSCEHRASVGKPVGSLQTAHKVRWQPGKWLPGHFGTCSTGHRRSWFRAFPTTRALPPDGHIPMKPERPLAHSTPLHRIPTYVHTQAALWRRGYTHTKAAPLLIHCSRLTRCDQRSSKCSQQVQHCCSGPCIPEPPHVQDPLPSDTTEALKQQAPA